MCKTILKISLLLGLYSGSSHAMDIRSMTPGNIIGTSIVAGCSIQFIKWICTEERYKQIWPVVRDYPGLMVMGVGTVTGLALMYGRPFASVFSNVAMIRPN